MEHGGMVAGPRSCKLGIDPERQKGDVVAGSQGLWETWRGGGVDREEDRISFQSYKNVLKSTVPVVPQLCENTKIHCTR